MSHKHPSGQRLLCAAGITLALLGLASQSVAQEVDSIPLSAVESMTVVRDPVTGKVRHATAEEQAALQAKAANKMRMMRVAPQQPEQKFHAKTGARGVRLTDAFTSSAVAVRKADGSIEMQCFDSHDAATTAAATGHVHTTKVETE